MKLAIDPGASSIVVRTRATGMLARFAHDLELVGSSPSGEVDVGALERGVVAGAWKGALRIAVRSFRVAGTLHGERLDSAALSASDRAEIEAKIPADVFPGTRELTIDVWGEGIDRGEVAVHAASARATARLRDIEVRERSAGAIGVRARCDLSLKALGAREVKGPLGAFKVADAIVVIADLVLSPA